MGNRVLKESVNESRGLTNCTFFAQDLYKRLITYADDYGRFNADPQIMLARLYPRELAVVSMEDLMDALVELSGVGKISFYTSNARKEVYGAFPRWGEHQRLRDSKKKTPDPEDSTVNDWYLRRFIPIDMKAAIVQRDNFKCKTCGKHVSESMDARRLVKMGTGMFHIDHIVPCEQGGRATMENLRLTCPKCNLSRKKFFSFEEILGFATNEENSPQLAETCRELPPEFESESNTNQNPNPNTKGKRTRFVPPTQEEAAAFFTENGGTAMQAQRFCDYYASKGWLVGKSPMKDWHAAARGWISRDKSSGYTEAYARPAEPPRTNNPFLQMLEEEGYAT